MEIVPWDVHEALTGAVEAGRSLDEAAAAVDGGEDVAGAFGTAAAAQAADPRHSRQGVDEVAGAWESLSAADRQRLLLTYPYVFGNLNGVSIEERAIVNEITVAGLRHKVEDQLEPYKHEPS